MTEASGNPCHRVAETSRRAADEWRAGWPIVVACFFGSTLISMGVNSMGVFMAPVEEAFGWSRTQFSLGFSLYAVAAILFTPLVGVMLDKWGVRRVSLPGALLVGVAFSLFATADGSMMRWLALWLLFASVNQLISVMAWALAVSRNFSASRGLALSIALMGSGVAAMAFPIASYELIERFGWRNGFVILGLGWGGVVALVGYFALVERQPDHRPELNAPEPRDMSGMAVADALLSVTYAKIAAGTFVVYVLCLAISLHIIPILVEGGLSRREAVIVTGFTGISMIIGKLIVGVISDRVSAKLVVAGAIFGLMISICIFRYPGTNSAWLVGAVIVFGLTYGGIGPTIPYLVSRHFGLRNFGRLFGIIMSIEATGFAVGPLLAGAMYDASRSYAPFLTAAVVALAIAMGIFLSLGKYPIFPRQDQDDSSHGTTGL